MASRPNGSSTSFIHTPSVYNDFPDEVKQMCEQVKCYYRFSPELLAPADEQDFTATGLNRHLLLKSQMNQNGGLGFAFPLVMTNATNTVKGLYFNFNVLTQLFNTGSYEGDTRLQKFIMSRILRPQYQYTHWWRAGDIMLFSQDLTLHSRQGVTNDQMERRLLFRYGFHV
jgi:alpha-ketoglutarate-dependent taurine dioxygenase